MADQLVRALIRGGTGRVVAAVTTDLLLEAARRHEASSDATLALGRAATAALLLATHGKDDQRVTLQLHGDGPIGSVTADAFAWGGVRMYAQAPPEGSAPGDADLALPSTAPGRPQVARVLGRRGTVNVIRDLGMRERYRGKSTLVTGEIDEDVEHYLRVSEQIQSSIGCDVVLVPGAGGAAAASAGLLVQAMPGAGETMTELLRSLQDRIRAGVLFEGLSASLAAGGPDALALAAHVLGADEPLQVLDRREPRFHCQCSRERVTGMLAMLGKNELAGMLAENRSAEIVCNFCRERYEVDMQELTRIAQAVEGAGRGDA